MSRVWVGITLAVVLSGFIAGPAQADPPEIFTGGVGGGFTNPCSGNFVSFETEGLQIIGTNFVVLTGQGSGIDNVTGEEFAVTFRLTGTSAQDDSGSFTGNSVIVFKGAANTFVVHSVSNVNFRPEAPTIVSFEFVSCAGQGPTEI